MWMLVPLILVPLVVQGFFWATNRDTFTVKEWFLQEAIMAILLVIGFQWARYGAIADTELWNGHLTAKDSGTQGCCHCRQVCDTCTRTNSEGRSETYSCRCREVCDHFRDYWWSLNVSTGDKINDSCNGYNDAPSWWTNALVGEPASIPHTYTNYLLADPDSVLLQHSTEEHSGSAPGYPKVYDRYKVTRFIAGGTTAPAKLWDTTLDRMNDELGSKKQVNIIVIATRNPSPSYADTVEVEWLYGKKNDVIFVLGAPDGDTIEWAKVVTISNVEMLKLTARDKMPGMKLSDVDSTSGFIRTAVDDQFTRTPMAEYEYLWASVQPTPFATFFLYLFAIIGSVIGSVIMVSKDVFGDERRRW
jgi:hypothetical protein